MGYEKRVTSNRDGYVFNRLGLWSSEDVAVKPLAELEIAESLPTRESAQVEVCGTRGGREYRWPHCCRIIQDTTGRFYLLGATAIIPTEGEDSTKTGMPVPLAFGGLKVWYPGITIAAPRAGTPLADFVDCVFPVDEGRKIFYARIQLRVP